MKPLLELWTSCSTSHELFHARVAKRVSFALRRLFGFPESRAASIKCFRFSGLLRLTLRWQVLRLLSASLFFLSFLSSSLCLFFGLFFWFSVSMFVYPLPAPQGRWSEDIVRFCERFTCARVRERWNEMQRICLYKYIALGSRVCVHCASVRLVRSSWVYKNS